MMLTVKQPPTYGYKSVHDLPTPPSTCRPSPPLNNQEPTHKSLPATYRNHSPPAQPMSAPHRGLPPPAAMTLAPQQPPAGIPPPTHHVPHPPPPPPSLPASHQPREPWPQLPAPPPQWQGAEDSMKYWLQARAEEDKRKQEEERTRQEGLRLEQRKVEMEMLRASLAGGIPPPMVPFVFTGMGSGGSISQVALEWGQQFLPPSQAPRAQILPPQGPVSPEQQREAQPAGPSQYHSLPPSVAPHPPGYAYPGSPTRPRGQTVAGTIGRPVSTLPSLNTNAPQPGHAPAPAMAPHQHMQQPQPPTQEPQASPSIYFHHWQPPTTQGGGGANRPGSPSGETPKKRKATGQHHAVPSPPRGEPRLRSPPPFVQSNFSNPAHRGRRGHARQRSDLSPYRSSGPGRARRESFGGPIHRMSPLRSSTPGPVPEHTTSDRSESQKHSVSSMLSEEPRPLSQQSAPPHAPEESERQHEQTPPTEVRAHIANDGTAAPSRDDTGEGEGV